MKGVHIYTLFEMIGVRKRQTGLAVTNEPKINYCISNVNLYVHFLDVSLSFYFLLPTYFKIKYVLSFCKTHHIIFILFMIIIFTLKKIKSSFYLIFLILNIYKNTIILIFLKCKISNNQPSFDLIINTIANILIF